MIFSASLKKSIFISFLGHIAIFSIFAFSFGNKILPANRASVFFWGAILRNYDLTPLPTVTRKLPQAQRFYAPKIAESRPIPGAWQEKPPVILAVNKDKMSFTPKLSFIMPLPQRKESAIIFHPLFPYHFTLYFKDRQKVHIELAFNIPSEKQIGSIAVKRKISSGNLEADLLSMRYIGHYLFIQQTRFPQDSWQTVKIDLSEADQND